MPDPPVQTASRPVGLKPGNPRLLPGRPPWAFFVLVTALTIPFWVVGAATGVQLLPGLPVAALAAVCPGLAAVILAYRENGAQGAQALLQRAIDYKRISAKVWYAPTLLLMPAVMALSFGVMRISGTQVPAPEISLVQTLILCAMFFAGAVGEELGWSAYAIDPMQDRWGALWASVMLGAFWAAFHYIGLAQAYRSVEWVAWWSLGTIALRILMVWIFNNTGKSVFAVALFHMTINLTWQLFPVNGSYYDPRISGLILAVVAVIVVVFWGPRRLTHAPYSGA